MENIGHQKKVETIEDIGDYKKGETIENTENNTRLNSYYFCAHGSKNFAFSLVLNAIKTLVFLGTNKSTCSFIQKRIHKTVPYFPDQFSFTKQFIHFVLH